MAGDPGLVGYKRDTRRCEQARQATFVVILLCRFLSHRAARLEAKRRRRPATEDLGAWGAFLSALGVALTLVGIRKVRRELDRLRRWLRPQPPRTHVGGATGSISVTAFGRGKVGPGPEGWTDEEWHNQLDRRIDRLTEEFDRHDHPKLDRAIADVLAEHERLRTGVDSKLSDIEADADFGQGWELAGLGLVFVGAVLQGLAVL